MASFISGFLGKWVALVDDASGSFDGKIIDRLRLQPFRRDADLPTKLQRHLRALTTRNVRVVSATVTFSMCVCMVMPGAWATTPQVFFRLNNMVTLATAIVLAVKTYEGRVCRCIVDLIYTAVLMHYIFYSSLSENRVQRLVALDLDHAIIDASRHRCHGASGTIDNSEAPQLFFLSCALVFCARFRWLPLRHFLCISIFAPCVWFSQVLLLGSSESPGTLAKLAGAYTFLCGLAFFVARNNARLQYSEFLQMHCESELLHILRHASMPVVLVGPVASTHVEASSFLEPPLTINGKDVSYDSENCGSELSTVSIPAGTDLRVVLWNDVLTKLTAVAIPEETSLDQVICFHPAERDALIVAVKKALDDEERTHRMLISLLTTSGVVWLQVDVWPIHMGGPKAIIIGSNVTEFVDQHCSLLYRLRGTPTGGISPNGGMSSAIEYAETIMPMSALIDRDTFILTRCKPHFNILFQHRMHGVSLLQHTAIPDDERLMRDAITKVVQGFGSQDMTVVLQMGDVWGLAAGRSESGETSGSEGSRASPMSLDSCGRIRRRSSCRRARHARVWLKFSASSAKVSVPLATNVMPMIARYFTGDGAGDAEVAKEARKEKSNDKEAKIEVNVEILNVEWLDGPKALRDVLAMSHSFSVPADHVHDEDSDLCQRAYSTPAAEKRTTLSDIKEDSLGFDGQASRSIPPGSHSHLGTRSCPLALTSNEMRPESQLSPTRRGSPSRSRSRSSSRSKSGSRSGSSEVAPQLRAGGDIAVGPFAVTKRVSKNPGKELRLDYVAQNLLALMRHFRADDLNEAVSILGKALLMMSERHAMWVEQWKGPCTSWLCRRCRAMNDVQDIYCGLCHMDQYDELELPSILVRINPSTRNSISEDGMGNLGLKSQLTPAVVGSRASSQTSSVVACNFRHTGGCSFVA